MGSGDSVLNYMLSLSRNVVALGKRTILVRKNMCCGLSQQTSSGLRGKASIQLERGPGIFFVAETQLSRITQRSTQAALVSLGRQQQRLIRCQFGAPAALRPNSSWAGNWTGVMQSSDYPCRALQLALPEGAWNTGRILVTQLRHTYLVEDVCPQTQQITLSEPLDLLDSELVQTQILSTTKDVQDEFSQLLTPRWQKHKECSESDWIRIQFSVLRRHFCPTTPLISIWLCTENHSSLASRPGTNPRIGIKPT